MKNIDHYLAVSGARCGNCSPVDARYLLFPGVSIWKVGVEEPVDNDVGF